MCTYLHLELGGWDDTRTNFFELPIVVDFKKGNKLFILIRTRCKINTNHTKTNKDNNKNYEYETPESYNCNKTKQDSK